MLKPRLNSIALALVCVCLFPCLAFSQGGSAVLPCVSGDDLPTATSALSAAGFNLVGSVTVFSDTVPNNEIASETPSCGSLIPTATSVQLTISAGSVANAGAAVFGTAFSGILFMFGLGLFFGMFVKLTNRS